MATNADDQRSREREARAAAAPALTDEQLDALRRVFAAPAGAAAHDMDVAA